jgi:hypothetical protein
MEHDSKGAPETLAPARQILRSIYLVTEGRYLAPCRLSSIPGVTAAAVVHAVRNHWLELKDNSSVCLTDEGRQLAIKQAN